MPAGGATKVASSVLPTCGTPATASVGAAWATTASTDASRGCPSAVHTAPAAAQSVRRASETVTSPVPDGATVTSQFRVLSASTCRTPVTAPPVSVNAEWRSISALAATSSLKPSPKVNAVSPSWLAGTEPKLAVSTSSFQIVPCPTGSPSRTPNDGLASTSAKTSPLSGTPSSMIVTSTVFTASPGSKVSVPSTRS